MLRFEKIPRVHIIQMEAAMSQNTTTNLGEGSIPSLLAKLAVPAVVAQVVNLLYNMNGADVLLDRCYKMHL